ncbi:paired amphipathic helix protein Sin3a [Massarina eburnea CBS 473.64]|uniref:Paired amphipathic helix protein Sin3a n=1 Tax=Massarina eburnea CBS 473.64 TaxID=1395130 RepID=A0A6A6RI29_9PLEO|nr:paired amphipathic helix protein Sin3a [Massarina eburnea CBS 473.64]
MANDVAPGPFYSSGAAAQHNQNISAMSALPGQGPQASPHPSAQRPPSPESGPPPQNVQSTSQGPPYSLPGISQTLQQSHGPAPNQANMDRERELREQETREREIMQAHAAQNAAAHQEEIKREADQRERELRERLQHEQAAHDNLSARERLQHEQAAHENHSAPIQIHQPVAVAPQTRTIHGPNGLLGQAGPLNGPAITGPSAPNSMFNGASGPPAQQQGETTPRMQHAVQPPSQASMLMPFPPGPQGQMAMGQGQQPILNDALSYLDQVKVQFAEHPDVYNRFLDIMKDFKSGAIDTPGVIERVSSLFAGHPNLIQGFNTFLPPGYKIECGTNGDPNAIRVTTPMGTMVSTMPAPRPLSPPRSSAMNGNSAPQNDPGYYEGQTRGWAQNLRDLRQPQPSENQEPAFSPNNRNLGLPLFGPQQGQAPLSPEAVNRSHPEAAASAAAIAHQQEQRGVSQLQNAVSAAAGRPIMSPSGDAAAVLPGQGLNGIVSGAQMAGAGAEKRGPVEFNHAISYVNKIKNRFATQPDIYKQFLEILQTYQRESKPIQDVYAQVTGLFSSAPDLLEDFKQFLPESAAQHRAQQAARHNEEAAMMGNARGDAAYGQAPNHQQTPRADSSRLPPMGNFAPTPTANRENKRKRGERAGAGAAAASVPAPTTQDVPTSNLRGNYSQNNNTKRAKTNHAKQPIIPDGPPVSPTLTPAQPEPMPPSTTTTPNQEELAFFDRVKKFIGNKGTMNEFLKLCNLFSQDLIDKNLLLYRAQSFIGGNQELFAWFKKFLGEEEEQQSTRPRTVNSRVALSNCRSLGPSYRLLPKREQERLCSGRDELCRSVLNDGWASHPTWASEDSGFVAHRKNQFEEGLHRIEEERHDYSFNIEACDRTIQQLEPIANQLLTMRTEDRANFHLPPGLGGQSETIYKRVIMKIYGREKGKDVIRELFTMPWSVVPVLLHRLKAKLEDWKAAQREWEKVWRDQTQKIFWKSLDHQSLSVKQNDKRQFQPKSLQNEIQVRYEEQKRLQEIQEIAQPDYQFRFPFKDEDVLFDVARLIITFADNSSVADFAKVVPFIKEFVPLFFGIDANKFDEKVQTVTRESSANGSGEDTPSAEEDLAHRLQKKGGDLRRNVLDPRGKPRKDKEDGNASVSRDSSPGITSTVDDEAAAADNSNSNIRDGRTQAQWVEYATQPTAFEDREYEHEEPYRRSEYNMYTNSSIYCFFRMFVYLYERLLKLKQTEDDVRRIVTRAQASKPAQELKMIDKLPSDFFKDTSDSANYYKQVLDLLEEQILGEIDMTQIEETMRRYYLQVGWQLYSFDRLLGSLVRFSLGVVNNDNKDKTLDIYNLFRKDRSNEMTTHKSEITYRKAVEKYAKDADTYRITYNPTKMEASVRLFKKDDPTFEFNQLDRIKRWRAYVASYMAVEPTEELDYTRLRYPYLKNRLNKHEDLNEEDRFETIKGVDKITVQINPQMYTMKFIATEPAGTGGVQHFVQPDTTKEPSESSKTLTNSRSERAKEMFCLNTVWMKDLSRDEVEAHKIAWSELKEKTKALEKDGENDVEMVDS